MECARTLDAWQSYLAEISDRITSHSFAESFQKTCPIDGVATSDYNYRLIEKDGLSIVTSIRFEGLDITKPFVELVLCDRSLDQEELRDVSTIVGREYVNFAPKRIRYFSHDNKAIVAEDIEDMGYYVADVKVIQELPKPDRYDEVSMISATSLDFYPAFEAIYSELRDAGGSVLFPESRSSMERSLEQGLLVEAFIEGQWAGVMSAHRVTDRFYYGVFIVEEILHSRFRGRGYGPALQRRFIDLLEPHSLVYGEIAAWNHASSKTALRVGREKCGSTFFHQLNAR